MFLKFLQSRVQETLYVLSYMQLISPSISFTLRVSPLIEKERWDAFPRGTQITKASTEIDQLRAAESECQVSDVPV